MDLQPHGLVLAQPAIRDAYQRAIDAFTVEDAVRHHSELIDLLAVEVVLLRASPLSAQTKDCLIRAINECARHHCDAVDRLTDVIENQLHLVWQPT